MCKSAESGSAARLAHRFGVGARLEVFVAGDTPENISDKTWFGGLASQKHRWHVRETPWARLRHPNIWATPLLWLYNNLHLFAPHRLRSGCQDGRGLGGTIWA